MTQYEHTAELTLKVKYHSIHEDGAEAAEAEHYELCSALEDALTSISKTPKNLAMKIDPVDIQRVQD